MSANKPKITLLISGVTLGVYVPALVINSQLKKLGYHTDVIALESLFTSSQKTKLPEAKKAFHKSFKFALAGQKLTGNIHSSIDKQLIDREFELWKAEERKHFIIFTELWLPLFEDFLSFSHYKAVAHVFHADSQPWTKYKTTESCYRHLWLFKVAEGQLYSRLNIGNEEIIPFKEREHRIIVHGGGWGIGTYKSIIPEATRQGLKLDIIAYEHDDLKEPITGNNYYFIDPEWKAWEKDANGEYSFPPLGLYRENTDIEFKCNKEFSEVYNLIRKKQAIISKPGGATLIDSLSSATPIVFLEPFGNYEQDNADLWVKLGFGVQFRDWKAKGYSTGLLENMHNNLKLAKNKVEDILECIRKSVDEG